MSKIRNINAWSMPRIITKDYQKSGKPGQFAITREKGRANRFQVQFALGAIAACPADAARIVQDALEILVWKIQDNWSNGLSAAGWPLRKPKPKKQNRKIPGIRRRIKYEKAGLYENEAIDGTAASRHNQETEKNAKYLARLSAWEATVKKNYTYKKELYRPPLNVTAENKIVGYWSGLLANSLAVATVKIKSRKGRVPQTVRTRLTVSPSRADAMKGLQMFDIVEGGDQTWQLVHDFMRKAVRETVIYRNWDNAKPITQNEIAKKYNDFLKRHVFSERAIKKIARTLVKGYSAI